MNIKALRQRQADLVKESRALLDKALSEGRDLTAQENEQLDALEEKIKANETNIKRVEAILEHERRAGGALPAEYAEPEEVDIKALAKQGKAFTSLGQQLLAVADFVKSNGRKRDERLFAGPAGLDEAFPAEGGFLVQSDFSAELLRRTYTVGEILQRVRKMPITNAANRLKINAIDETSRADGSRFGGVQAFWANEADTLTATKPKFRQVELILNKLTAIVYATDELLADAPALESLIADGVSQEFSFKMEDGIVNGPGSGQPLGIMTSAVKVQQAKEGGQAANTVLAANVMKMWSRCWGRSRLNAVWLYDQSIEPQLFQMTLPNAGVATPIWLPPGGLSGSPYGTIFGRPMIPVEYCAQLTTEGDIILADLSQYLLADKGGMAAASSMHVRFLTDEMTYRFTLRTDGQPWWNKPLTPKNGGPTLSPFITLQSR
jgi:HK97 family phage major capsid protein